MKIWWILSLFSTFFKHFFSLMWKRGGSGSGAGSKSKINNFRSRSLRPNNFRSGRIRNTASYKPKLHVFFSPSLVHRRIRNFWFSIWGSGSEIITVLSDPEHSLQRLRIQKTRLATIPVPTYRTVLDAILGSVRQPGPNLNFYLESRW